MTKPILIVGAGPTGLTAALELSRLGVPLRIIDKQPAPATTSRAVGCRRVHWNCSSCAAWRTRWSS
jgi:2-polyprenyl-6-methoxyphenol hydroxylase-like FAD-dependent oxidoreductase